MRKVWLSHAIAVGLMVGAPTVATAVSPPAAHKASQLQTYIVRLQNAPLASYRGAGANKLLQQRAPDATSPSVTGAPRLDLQSKAARAYRDYLDEQRADFIAEAARAVARPLQIGFEYDVAFNGLTLDLTAAEAERIAKLPGVAAIEPEFIAYPQTDAGPRWVEADRIWDGSLGAATRGEGVVVGIIDSGINATHASFAGTGPVDGYVHANPRGQFFGLCATTPASCNTKLIGIHDFTVCTGTHNTTGCDDREPNDGGNPDTHGSHVASTAVGNVLNASISLPTGAVTRQLSGVAPHANLIAYKACEDEEACRGSWLLAAINQAVADGVQVINYSIGGDPRDPWAASDAQAMLAARDAGIVVAVSAGNDGPGAGTVGAPSNAPWVLSVANSSHDRVIVNRLLDLSGGDTAAPGGGILLGDGLTAGYGPVDLVVPNDFPLCSIGNDLDSPPSGASNPWQPGRFNGEIVVCRRGVQARVAKSNNVRLAGGGGMVLVNTELEGESTVADQHSIPATHLGFNAGSQLLQWLSSGSGHRGRLEGAQVRSELERADILNTSSSRGPVEAGAYLKPDLSAPGTSILAASGTGTGFAFLSGTSMASPHVAGAAALLRALHPDWTVSDIQSALRSTASQSIRLGNGTPATAFEQGSGRLRLSTAHRMGLSFELSRSELLSANPSAGGNPKTLNLPSLIDSDCFETCTFTRRVTDRRGGGRWVAEVSAESGMQIAVTPNDFNLAAGAAQSLQFSVDVRDPQLLGRYVEGRVILRAVDSNGAPVSTVSTAELPVRVFADPGSLPTTFNLSTEDERGFVDVSLNGLVALQDLDVAATALATPELSDATLAGDPTPGSIYDSFNVGSLVRLVELPASSVAVDYQLTVHADSTTSRDIDLYVGFDADGDGLPDQSEELCASTTALAIEDCSLTISSSISAQRYWILVQNFSASTLGNDVVQLRSELVNLTPVNGPSLVASGPARSGRLQPFTVRLAFDDPSLLPGERRVGFVQLRAGGAEQPLGRVPVVLQRQAATASAAKVLYSGEVRTMRLAPGAASDRLVIDVPSNAAQLHVQTSGTGEVDVYLARIDTPAGPQIAAAPSREAAQLSGRSPGANEDLMLTTGNGLAPGRWYVTPVNAGSTAAEFSLQVELVNGAELALPRPGAYFNPARDGSGAFVFGAGETLGFLWYTYLQDGTPAWYIGSGLMPTATEGTWSTPLYRARWNGVEAPLTEVGRVVMAKRDDRSFQFGWNLDGESGSEVYEFIDGGGCAQQGGQPFDINGFWFNPAQPGYGYSVNAFPTVETNGAYFFDGEGRGRWALGAASPFGTSTLSFDLLLGPCPSCTYSTPQTIANIGTLTRTYTGDSSGQMSLNLQLPAPLTGTWQVDTPVQKLTEGTGCP